MATTKYTLVAIVEDKPGVLNRIVSVFRRRNFNIESISEGRTEGLSLGFIDRPGRSRITIMVKGDEEEEEEIVEQVRKQLQKLIYVIKVIDVTTEILQEKAIIRELALIKVVAPPERRGDIVEIANIFRADIVDVSSDSIIVQVTGDQGKIDSLRKLLIGYGIEELARTGVVAMSRGLKSAIREDQPEVERRRKAKG